MLSTKFFISYTFCWVIFLTIGISLNKIESLNNALIIKLIILSTTIAAISIFLFKQLPKINITKVTKTKLIVIILGFEIGYIILRGLIPDQVLPHTLIIGSSLRYLYTLIILSILIKTKKV